MKKTRKRSTSVLQALELQLTLLVDDYSDEPANLSHHSIAEVLGRVFAAQCLTEHGLRGYQYADQGIQAILSALREMPRAPALSAMSETSQI